MECGIPLDKWRPRRDGGPGKTPSGEAKGEASTLTKVSKIGHVDMGVSINGGTSKSSILVGFSLINHPAIGVTPIYENLHIG